MTFFPTKKVPAADARYDAGPADERKALFEKSKDRKAGNTANGLPLSVLAVRRSPNSNG
jgi:hypothetical protein